MKDSFTEEEELQSFGYKHFGVREGDRCTKYKTQLSLKAAIFLLYVLCTLLAIAVAILGYKVVQRVDHVSENIEHFQGKIVAMETSLKYLDGASGEKSENATSSLQVFRAGMSTLHQRLSEITDRVNGNQATLHKLQDSGQTVRTAQRSLRSQLELDTEMLRRVNTALTFQSINIHSLQELNARLQQELQKQVKVERSWQVTMYDLNHTQEQQVVTVMMLQQSLEVASQAMQHLHTDVKTLMQSTRHAQTDTEWLQGKMQNLQGLCTNASDHTVSNRDRLEELSSELNSLMETVQNISMIASVQELSLRQFGKQQLDYDNHTGLQFETLETRSDQTVDNLDHVTGNISSATHLLGDVNTELKTLRDCSDTISRHSDVLLGLNITLASMKSDSTGLRSAQDDLSGRLDQEVSNLSMLIEEMKLVDHHHTQFISNFSTLMGPPGCRGSHGDQGPQGVVGPPGQKGQRGNDGEPGQSGFRGETGEPGLPGFHGLQGAQGFLGSSGSKGPRGSGGRVGVPGTKGEPGSPGQPGSNGQLGHPGPPGPAGIQGQIGPSGDEGPRGLSGPPGSAGPHGLPGIPGRHLILPPLSEALHGDPLPSYSSQETGCPVDWLQFKDSCYLFSVVQLSFDEAKKNCDSNSASMVMINDVEEQRWLHMQTLGKGYFWLGLTDRNQEEVWQWVDGSFPVITNWKQGQPDNWRPRHGEGEDCAGLVHQGLWNDFHCDLPMSSICEKPICC
ncbi:collectin-12-like isoform X2 [Denticeps clupeoides]|nr:collectin-12 isoform X2 [Denticeps clupeoides]